MSVASDEATETSTQLTLIVMISRILFFLMWLILSLVISLKFYSDFTLNYPASSVKYFPCLLFGIIFWLSWALVAHFIALLSQWLFGKDRYWIRFLICHLAAGVLFSLLTQLLMVCVFKLFFTLDWFPHSYYPLSMLLLNYSIYVAMVAIEHAVSLFDRNTRLEIQQAQLKAELSDARWQALSMQLHPHFFFNSLNTVRMLIETDSKKAIRMTTLLGDFLRSTLNSSEENEVLFARELEFIQGYLEIQQIRFENRIRIHFDISDEAMHAMVPYLILQPIVENAMLHGCGKSMTNGELRISAKQRDQSLVIGVQDSGCGQIPPDFSEGIGLSNTRSRLRSLYGGKGIVSISVLPGGNTQVELQMPFQKRND